MSRDWVPDSSHVPLKPPHPPQPPGMSSGQSPSSPQPVQVLASSLHVEAPGHGSPAWLEQLPAAHVSAPLQKTPSSQVSAFGTCSHPLAPQASSVHGLPSSQPAAAHSPPQQMSEPRQSAGPVHPPASVPPASGLRASIPTAPSVAPSGEVSRLQPVPRQSATNAAPAIFQPPRIVQVPFYRSVAGGAKKAG